MNIWALEENEMKDKSISGVIQSYSFNSESKRKQLLTRLFNKYS